MAYIGAVAPGYDPTRASVPQLDAERFSGNASTTAFTLARQVVSPTDIDVVVENVTQEPTVAYSVNGNTLTFTEAPGTGTNNIYVVYRGSGISNYAFVPDGSITFAKLANNIKQFTVDAVTANGTGTTVALTEAPASANSIIVSVDGVIQTAPTNYTLSGSTITFTGVPDNGANVVVRHIGFRTTSTVTALQASSVTATEIADGSITTLKIASGVSLTSANLISATATSGITHRGSTSGTTVLQSSAVASGTLTLPAATDTLVGKATTDTLTNKTLTSPTISGNTPFNTNTLFVDATNSRVGIGKSNPLSTLDVTRTSGSTTTSLGNFEAAIGGYTGTSLVASNSLSTDSSYKLFECRSDSDGDAGGPFTQFQVRGDGLMYMNSGYGTSAAAAYGCRAWVNFNGAGTVAIRGSGNVSSITDNAVGSYTMNFTTSMPDINYCATGVVGIIPSISEAIIVPNFTPPGTETASATSSFKFATIRPNVTSAADANYVYLTIFR